MKASIEILERHNRWRRGAEIEMESPYQLGIAIDDCVKAAKRYELIRTLNIPQMQAIYKRNLAGELFDDIIDELIEINKP